MIRSKVFASASGPADRRSAYLSFLYRLRWDPKARQKGRCGLTRPFPQAFDKPNSVGIVTEKGTPFDPSADDAMQQPPSHPCVPFVALRFTYHAY